MKRLKAPTGNISGSESKESDSLDEVVRKAVLVHSGPNGSKMFFYTGDYDSENDPPEGDIFFDGARIKNVEKEHNKLINKLAKDYGGFDKMPDGAFPALLDQHEDDTIFKVIGRLASEVKHEVMDVPGVGKNCSCLTADLTFKGKEIVERVNDGRIFHLSVGIDEETDTIGELSAVITPAAPGARLLKKGDNKMPVKKLDAHKKKLSTLRAMKDTLTGMTKKVVAANEKVKLAARQGIVTHRLTALVRGGKITPAEFKKMNVKDLSKLPEEHLSTMMNAFESMEPKIMAGQRGTVAAMDFASIGKNLQTKQMTKLKSEIKGDFKRMGKKLSSDDESEKEEKIQDKSHEMAGKEEAPSEHMAKHMEAMKQMKAHMEAGDMKSALACHAAAMKHLEEGKGGESEIEKKELELGDVKSEDYQKSSNELQAQVDELNTQIARIAGMVEELMTDEEAEMSEGFGEDETKKLTEEEDKKSKLAKEEDDKKALSKEEEDKKKLESEEEDKKKLESEEEEKKKLAKEEEDKKKLEEKEKVKKELKAKK